VVAARLHWPDDERSARRDRPHTRTGQHEAVAPVCAVIGAAALEHRDGFGVVEPRETWVLKDTGDAILTLVTCYPFNYVGPAPQRFIVRARRIAGDGMPAPTEK